MSGYMARENYMKGKVFKDNDIDIEQYLPQLYRVLKNDSHCYIMCNNFNLLHFADVIAQSDFHFTKLLVWNKVNKICGTYYMGQVEHIFFLRKGKGRPINECGTSDLLTFPNVRDKNPDGSNIHDSQKPIGLMQALITNSSHVGGVILDPFIGSGTTAIAAIKTGRHFIGFELDKKYYDIARKRIKDEQAQLTLF